MKHCQKVDGIFLKSGGDAPAMFQFVDQALDQVAFAVERLLNGYNTLAFFLRRNHRRGTAFMDRLPKRGSHAASVGNDVAGGLLLQERLGLGDIGHFTAGEDQPQGKSFLIIEQMNLGAQSASGAPQRLVVFFLEPAAC
jgi:hypothetical protein